jgi:hypothetical protein
MCSQRSSTDNSRLDPREERIPHSGAIVTDAGCSCVISRRPVIASAWSFTCTAEPFLGFVDRPSVRWSLWRDELCAAGFHVWALGFFGGSPIPTPRWSGQPKRRRRLPRRGCQSPARSGCPLYLQIGIGAGRSPSSLIRGDYRDGPVRRRAPLNSSIAWCLWPDSKARAAGAAHPSAGMAPDLLDDQCGKRFSPRRSRRRASGAAAPPLQEMG